MEKPQTKEVYEARQRDCIRKAIHNTYYKKKGLYDTDCAMLHPNLFKK